MNVLAANILVIGDAIGIMTCTAKRSFGGVVGSAGFSNHQILSIFLEPSNEGIQKVLTAQTVDLPMANTSWFSNSKSESDPTRRIPHL